MAHRSQNSSVWVIVLSLATSWPSSHVRAAEEHVETFPDGTKKAVYTVAADGVRNGPFEEYYPDGKLKVQGTYRRGKLNGPYKEHHPGGRIKIRTAYFEGELVGTYVEFAGNGDLLRRAKYRAGKLHGNLEHYIDGQKIRDEVWLDGQMLIPRSAAMIAAGLAKTKKLRIQTVGKMPAVNAKVKTAVEDPALQAKREAAMRVLMAYRCVCDLPFEDLKLDKAFIAHTEAASQLLGTMNRLEHEPPNPGIPEAEYRFARQGTSSSNLAPLSSPTESVRAFMDDSDPSNIARVGHRRWCLNPAMLRTGFGSSGGITAMWAVDSSRTEVPDFEYVAFPPRGLCPTSSFRENYAWSISFHPKKFRIPDPKAVKVQVAATILNLQRVKLEKVPVPLPLDYFNVDTTSTSIIFRPQGVHVLPGSSYSVHITGIQNNSGADTSIQYLVAFFAL